MGTHRRRYHVSLPRGGVVPPLYPEVGRNGVINFTQGPVSGKNSIWRSEENYLSKLLSKIWVTLKSQNRLMWDPC